MNMNNMPKAIENHTFSANTSNCKTFSPYDPAKLQIIGTTYNSSGHSKCDILHVAKFTKNGKIIDGIAVWKEYQQALLNEGQINK